MVSPASSTVTFFMTMLVHIVCRISGFNTHWGTTSGVSVPACVTSGAFANVEVLVIVMVSVVLSLLVIASCVSFFTVPGILFLVDVVLISGAFVDILSIGCEEFVE